MSKGNAVQVVKNVRPPAVAGEHHRILCMTGEGKGVSYYLKGNRVVLGRGDTVDVKVMDVKSSREHAEIVKVGKNFVLTDLKSQNGTMVNDLKVNQHTLKDGDKIIIGQTVFKYNVFVVQSAVVKEEKADENENDENEEDTEEASPKDVKSKKPLIMLILGAVVVFLFLGGEEEGPKAAKKDKEFKNVTDDFTADVNKKKRMAEDKEIAEKLDTIIQRGLRELREGNYFRAMNEFQFALTVSPNNGRASFYMNKTKQALHSEIDENLIKARRDQESLKYMSAIQSYCNILRLLEGYEEDENYKKAQEEIKQVEAKMGLDEGEIVCANYDGTKK